MQPIRDPQVLARFQMAFDLYQTAEDIMRQNLRRRLPEASEAEIEDWLNAWLRKEPNVLERAVASASRRSGKQG